MCFAIVSATDIVLSKKIFKPILFTIYSRKKTLMSDMRTNSHGSQTRFVHGATGMSKYEIIDCIMDINKTARQEFLNQFTVEDLDLYLEHLMQVDLEEIALCA